MATTTSENAFPPASDMQKTVCDIDKWGFSLSEMFKLAIAFLKDKDGTAVHLTYEDRLQFYSLRRQALHGSYANDKFGDVGILDIASKDRKARWQSLGNMNAEDAMHKYCQLLFDICPQFTPYIDAHKRDKEERERLQKEEEEEERRKLAEQQEQEALAEEARKQAMEDEERFDNQRLQIQRALNQQTEAQFRSYANQQFPNDTQQQDNLVRQLQEQHYQRYMQQIYEQQEQQVAAGVKPWTSASPHNYYQQGASVPRPPGPTAAGAGVSRVNGDVGLLGTTTTAASPGSQASVTDANAAAAHHDAIDASILSQARMWTRKDMKEFKDKIKQDNDGIIKVGQGETVTVRVPTYHDGKYLFWEFATDHYDIGFGLYFEWVPPESNNVSVLFGDGSDDSYESEEENNTKDDIEKAGGVTADAAVKDNKPPIDEIIPIYRRDCHEEVYAGSHKYPGSGVYLLKFDNCYSLWRSKTLYYRVYYTC